MSYTHPEQEPLEGTVWHPVAIPATCDRCGRESHPWPLKRPGNSCSPEHWAHCIREVSP